MSSLILNTKSKRHTSHSSSNENEQGKRLQVWLHTPSSRRRLTPFQRLASRSRPHGLLVLKRPILLLSDPPSSLQSICSPPRPLSARGTAPRPTRRQGPCRPLSRPSSWHSAAALGTARASCPASTSVPGSTQRTRPQPQRGQGRPTRTAGRVAQTPQAVRTATRRTLAIRE